MKKLVLMLAVIFSVSLVSCGGNKAAENAEEAAEVVTEEVVEEVAVADTVAADSVVAPADSVVVAE